MTETLAWDHVASLRPRLAAHVVVRAMVTETVLLNIETGQYFAVDAVGGRFLQVLRSADSLTSAADELAAEYGQPEERIHDDLLAFLDALQQRGLLDLE